MIGAVQPGTAFAIEGKVNRLVGKLNLKSLFYGREHELHNLLHMKSVGSLAWVIIAFRGKAREWKCFAMDPAIANGLALNGSSDMDELVEQNMMFELPPMGEGCWDLSKLFT